MNPPHAAVRRSRAVRSRVVALSLIASASASASALGQDAHPAPTENAPAAGVPTNSAPAALLPLAEAAMTQVNYARARELARAAIAHGGLDRPRLIQAYRLIAISSAQLGEESAAEQAFVRLFALEPDSNVASRLAPARRSAVLNAHGFWAVRGGFGLDVAYARRDRKLVVRVRDPLIWVDTVHVWWRREDQPYQKLQRAAATELIFDTEGMGPSDPIEVYAFGLDARGNVLVSFAKGDDPHVFTLSERELAEYLRRDIRGGQIGSYARRLEELGVEVSVHGYLSLELKPDSRTDVATFDLHHATAMIRASVQNAVSLEMALEWEHLAREPTDFYFPHAFMDIELLDALIVRAGFFEVPVGAFNEYLYPDFLRITGQPPLFVRGVIPALWSEVGLQLRGRFSVDSRTNLSYAAFLVNGLEQADDDPSDGRVAEGGALQDMRFHARDRFSGDKGFGGRVGLEVGEFDVGLSSYTGRYTVEAPRQLSIADVDLSYRSRLVTLRGEAAVAWQETSDALLRKYGFYFLLALRPSPYLEPYAMYDYADAGSWEQRALLGFAFYPFPNERSTRHLRLKSEAGVRFLPNDEQVFAWFFQLTTAF